MSDVVIVNAKDVHSEMLWEWRNDPMTRQMSNNTEKISWEDHSCWYEKVLLDNSRKLYLGEERGIPIGVVRFDKCDNEEYVYEVSINISPESILGNAFLSINNGADIWVYFSKLNRSRKIVDHAKFEKVLGGDFTYLDLSGKGQWRDDYRIKKINSGEKKHYLLVDILPNSQIC